MALAAAQVVDALATRLAAQAALGGRVKTSRTWPWSEAELPAARVFVADEVATPAGLDSAHEHRLSIDAQISARATADLDDTLHTLAEGALPLLFADPLPYGLTLAGINRELATEGEAAVGRITLQLQCLFYSAPTAPDTFL